MEMKQQRIFFLILFIIYLSFFPVYSQQHYKIIYKNDTFLTFNTKYFLDSTFQIPPKVPDGKWIILSEDSLPIYEFNTLNNLVNGEYSEFWDGNLKTSGYYRNDSLWTFRFNSTDERFKDSNWMICAGAILDSSRKKVRGFSTWTIWTYNKWFSNGIKEYEKRGHQLEIWYYRSGEIKRIKTAFQNSKNETSFDQYFDSVGKLKKIVTIKTTSKKKKHESYSIFVSCDIVEYNGIWKTREIIEDKKHTIYINYGNFGQEIKRTKIRKKTK